MQYFDPRGGSNRYKIKVDFFQTWSNKMAYVLGFLYADGNIEDAVSSRTQYIKFTSKDKDIIEAIKSVLQSEHPIQSRSPKQTLFSDGKIYTSSKIFFLRIGSRKMFADFKKFGLVPNKSKIMKFPNNIPSKYLSQFVRGYFDGDGCVYINKIKNKEKVLIPKKFNVIFTSGSKLFLEGLSSNLKKMIKLNQDNVNNSKRAYQLRYSVSDSIELFKFLYKNTPKELYLKRKLKIFLEYFQLRPSKIDEEIKLVFNDLNLAWYPRSLGNGLQNRFTRVQISPTP